MIRRGLVRAAREKGDQDHQVGKGEQPLIGLEPRRFSRAGDEAEMTALGEIMEMIHANTSQSSDFRIGEDFLTRLYGNHGFGPLHLSVH